MGEIKYCTHIRGAGENCTHAQTHDIRLYWKWRRVFLLFFLSFLPLFFRLFFLFSVVFHTRTGDLILFRTHGHEGFLEGRKEKKNLITYGSKMKNQGKSYETRAWNWSGKIDCQNTLRFISKS